MKIGRTILILLAAAAAFVGGYGYRRWYFRAQPPSMPAAQPAGRRILYYVDPMHPAYKSDKPGFAPDCGMKLQPVYAEEGASGMTVGMAMPGGAAMPGAVHISPEKQHLIGVKYGTVEYTRGSRTIRTVGKVAYDETRIARVHTKIEGWIDRVFVNFTGDAVEKGRPLLTLYSPEMLASEQEFLLALRAKDVMQHSTMAEMPAYSDSLLAATRRRLELWDLSEPQIEQIAQRRQPLKNVTIEAPISGYVTARNAFPSQRITPETELYTIADLSKVWVMADVFEYEAPLVRIGQPAVVTLSYYPGRTLRGRVSYIQPQVDPVTRTVKVRIELANPANVLKPEMFADVELPIAMPERLTVPAEAVLDSGQTKTVFVDRGDGYFEPRTVETGERLDGRIEILKGLKAGERIVTSGNFLIDSESRLKAATSGMEGMPMEHQH